MVIHLGEESSTHAHGIFIDKNGDAFMRKCQSDFTEWEINSTPILVTVSAMEVTI